AVVAQMSLSHSNNSVGRVKITDSILMAAPRAMSIHAPSIGIELADDVTEKFPPAQRSISCQIGFDGAVRDV
ncbi:MAG: hypothetical protein K2K53_00070, partial [Oscillospiraceae bacterium]|nr:hypothetical protein [Oscillospiraceae bacterium]